MRTLFAIAACSISWLSLFGALKELENLKQLAAEASSLGRMSTYELRIKRDREETISVNSVFFDRQFIEQSVSQFSTYIIETNRYIDVLTVDRQNRISTKVFVHSPNLALENQTSEFFPDCSFIHKPYEWEDTSSLVSLGNSWRCSLIELPQSMKILSDIPGLDGLVVSQKTVQEFIDREWQNTVSRLYVGAYKQRDIEMFLEKFPDKMRLAIELTPIATAVQQQSDSLSVTTKIWVLLAGILLVLSIVLYVHGVLSQMRQEFGLRACLGIPFFRIISWIVIDANTQAIALICLSFSVGLFLNHFLINCTLESAFGIFVGITSYLFLFLSMICLILSLKGVLDKKTILLLKN